MDLAEHIPDERRVAVLKACNVMVGGARGDGNVAHSESGH